MSPRPSHCIALVALALAACPAPSSPPDAAPLDARSSDGQAPADALAPDAIQPDAMQPDAPPLDVAAPDVRVEDAPRADVLPPDSPALDALAAPDSTTPADASPAADALAPVDTFEDRATDAPADTPTDAPADTPTDASPDAALGPAFCTLGSDVPGLRAPEGFCIRRFAAVTNPRTLTFAPNGDLFVGAPRAATAGAAVTTTGTFGGAGGPGAVMIVTDDDRNGVGEPRPFASTRRSDAGAIVSGIPTVHGIGIGGGYLYFTTEQQVFRTPYRTGQREETRDAVESLRLPSATFGNTAEGDGRWTHGLAVSTDGTVFASRGQYGSCGMPETGSIYRVAPARIELTSTGFRNPMYLRCHFADPVCLASELGEDGQFNAVEKLVEVLAARDYGYPCCQSRGRSSSGTPSASCDTRAAEARSFPMGDTPFGLDWERGFWPASHRGAIFVAMHGSYYRSAPRYPGAGIRFARTSATTHLPNEEFSEFMGRAHGIGEGLPIVRPSDAAFAPDGRLFIADDHGHAIYWIAPLELRVPAR